MSISLNKAVGDARHERFMANRWSPESLADVIEHGYDAKSLDKIAETNAKLVETCLGAKDEISHRDIYHPISRVLTNDEDWLAHLDFAFALANANPEQLKYVIETKQLVELAQLRTLVVEEPQQTARQKLLGFPRPAVTQPKQDPRQASVASFVKAFNL